MEKREIPKELGLFYVIFLTVPLYIQRYQFIIVQFTLPTPSYIKKRNTRLVFKMLHMKLNIVVLLTLKVVPGDHPTRIEKNRLY